jgi:hypothetical protein
MFAMVGPQSRGGSTRGRRAGKEWGFAYPKEWNFAYLREAWRHLNVLAASPTAQGRADHGRLDHGRVEGSGGTGLERLGTAGRLGMAGVAWA